MWLANITKPDISTAVREVVHHNHNPFPEDWKAVRQTLVYLLGARTSGLTFKQGGGLKVNAYVDSSYASKANNRRSVSGV